MFNSRLSLLALPFLFLARRIESVKWNLTVLVQANSSSFTAIDQDPSSIPFNGVCLPAIISLSANQGWFWCGWSAIQRTLYTFNSSGPISVQLMRQSAITSCSPSGIKSCEVIYGSLSDTLNASNWEVAGLAFPDPICILFANNNNKASMVSLQVFQWYDSSRYYGTVFTLVMTILLFGGVLSWVGWTCYHELTKTTDRVAELRNFESELSRNASEASLPQLPKYATREEATTSEEKEVEGTSGASNNSLGARVRGAFSSLGNLVPRKASGAEH